MPIFGHHYGSGEVLLSVLLYLSTSAGFRGVSRSFGLFSIYLAGLLKQMSYSTLNHWVLRLGYGLLTQPLPKSNDWIYILDHSIQLGTDRCLVILGVRAQSLGQDGYNLTHQQMQVLDIYIHSKACAQVVYERLGLAAKRSGRPVQVLSDQGADIRKGVALFAQDHPRLICSSDITHKIGCLLKKYLPTDPRWVGLETTLTSISHRIKQSNLSFLRPATVGKKSRWLNIEKIMSWLTQLFRYQQQGDFGLIARGFQIANPDKILAQLYDHLPDKRQAQTLKKKLTTLVVQTPEDLRLEPLSQFPAIIDQIQWVPRATVEFENKFQPLFEYRAFAKELDQLHQVLSQTKTIIKNEGLSLDTLAKIERIETEISYPLIRKLYTELVNFLVKEHAQAGPDPRAMLLCSDVIESIFGKYKAKAKTSVGGMYQSVLMIPLFCETLSHQKIKSILEEVSIKQVYQWIDHIRGPSNLAKRRRAFKFT